MRAASVSRCLFLALAAACSRPYDAASSEAAIDAGDAGEAGAAELPCPNGALRFDGKGFVKVEAPDQFDSPSDLTVEAWILPDAQTASSEVDIVSHHDTANSDGWVLLLRGGLGFRVYSGPGDGTKIAANVAEAIEPSLTLGAWHHVAAVFEGGTKSITLFIDGKSTGPNFRDKAMADRYGGPLAIGAAAFRAENGFLGIIDEVRVSRRVRYRGAATFRPAYPLPDDEDLTIGTWHFTSGTGPLDMVKEASGRFTSTLATFATPTPQYPTAVTPDCPTGARP